MKIRTWKGQDRTETETTIREHPEITIDKSELRDFNVPTVLQLDIVDENGKVARFWLSTYINRGQAVARISTNRGKGSLVRNITTKFKEHKR